MPAGPAGPGAPEEGQYLLLQWRWAVSSIPRPWTPLNAWAGPPVEWGHQALADRIMAAKLPDGFTLRNIDRAKWSGLTDRKTIEDALA